jgi:peptidoglycan hydrolase-like protein with peptidoglycan-binding domain
MPFEPAESHVPEREHHPFGIGKLLEGASEALEVLEHLAEVVDDAVATNGDSEAVGHHQHPAHFAGEITLGDATEQVRVWQERMAEVGLTVTVTGIYDHESEACCREFQSSRSLDVTGIIDLQTWDVSFS